MVFLDEMTTSLDPAARRVAWELIRTVADRGTTVVLVTHFMDEAERICDRVAVMNGGRLVAQGTPRGLVNDYVPEMRLAFRVDGLDLSWLAAVPTVRKVNRHGGCVDVEGVDRWSWAARTSCAVRASLQVAALAVRVIVRRSRTHVTGLIRTA